MTASAPVRTTYVGVSTKMYLGYAASLAWLEEVGKVAQARRRELESGGVQLFVIPSFPVLESARRLLAGLPVRLGAQNCGWGEGAFTGEVSPGILAEMGVGLVEIGHAERRALFGEDDAMAGRKVSAALAAGVTPLLCVGEPERGTPAEAAAFCARQVLAAAGENPLEDLVLAYEPVWAIGAKEPAPASYINAVLSGLRTLLPGPGAPVIYGGSAGPGLLPQLQQADGLFLGRFAHDPANLALVLDEALSRTAAPA